MTTLPTPAELRDWADDNSDLHWLDKAAKIQRALLQFATQIESQIRPQSAVQGWQPIETAPKDGIPIILGWPKMALGGYWAEWRGTWTTAHGEYVGENEPTHWMPLPDAPQPPQGEGCDYKSS
jgi:hypothetical protein